MGCNNIKSEMNMKTIVLYMVICLLTACGKEVSPVAVITKDATLDMVLIPSGTFDMGNCLDPDEGSLNELPVHSVYISAFYMDKYEVV
jgi:formylglycine-generating enzyme required for sulfatase activity